MHIETTDMAPETQMPRCPECEATSGLTELDRSPTGDHWMQCENCSYIWRWAGRRVDAFELIVHHRAAGAKLRPDHRPPRGVPRAPRYAVRLTLRYRLASSIEWQLGQTENISKSGVLFRTQQSGPLFKREIAAQPRHPVELELELPTANPESPISHVRCLGEVVRTSAPEAHDMLPTVAAAVQEYQLAPV